MLLYFFSLTNMYYYYYYDRTITMISKTVDRQPRHTIVHAVSTYVNWILYANQSKTLWQDNVRQYV